MGIWLLTLMLRNLGPLWQAGSCALFKNQDFNLCPCSKYSSPMERTNRGFRWWHRKRVPGKSRIMENQGSFCSLTQTLTVFRKFSSSFDYSDHGKGCVLLFCRVSIPRLSQGNLEVLDGVAGICHLLFSLPSCTTQRGQGCLWAPGSVGIVESVGPSWHSLWGAGTPQSLGSAIPCFVSLCSSIPVFKECVWASPHPEFKYINVLHRSAVGW